MTRPFDLEVTVIPYPDSATRRFVSIRAVARVDAPRNPVALALALDRSSSMKGPPLADAKRAAADLVRLLGDDDSFALVVFDRQVATMVSPGPIAGRREAILAAIDETTTGYGTDLGTAADRVLQHARSMGSHARALLFTDGNPFVGLRTAKELGDAASEAAKGLPLTTVGFGDNVDCEVLHAMATGTTGRFLQLAIAADPRLALGTELGSLRGVVAHDVRMTFDLADGVKLGRVHHRGPMRSDGRRLEVRLASVGVDEPARLVFELELDPDSEARPESLGTLTCAARDRSCAAPEALVQTIPAAVVEPSCTAKVDVLLALVATGMVRAATEALGGYGRRGSTVEWLRTLSILADALGIADDPKVRAAFHFYIEMLDASGNDLDSVRDLIATIDGVERQYEARFGYSRDSHHAFDLRTPLQAEGEREITRVSGHGSLRRRR